VIEYDTILNINIIYRIKTGYENADRIFLAFVRGQFREVEAKEMNLKEREDLKNLE
jgi:hypothetical protein